MGERQREFGKNVIGQLVGGLGFGKGGTLLDVYGMAYDEGCVWDWNGLFRPSVLGVDGGFADPGRWPALLLRPFGAQRPRMRCGDR